MKRTITIITMLILTTLFVEVKSQNNVGIGTTTPNASALLDLTSTSRGLLIPRVALLAVGNATSPVNAPATGLLVYNTGGALAAGFWYWNGSQWTQIGAGGGSCSTLDQAYDCGGAGTGRIITADAGQVEINLPLSATNNYGLSLTSNKGTNPAPSSPIYAINTQHGTALFVESTLAANLYGAIQASFTTTNANASVLPASISGYKAGNGIGAGVYGEAIGSIGTAGSGVSGYASNNNFGGDFWSQNFVGLQAETSQNGTQALQVVSSGANALQPSIYSRGWSQFQASTDPSGHSAIINNLGGEVTIAPSTGSYGFLGTASVAWWYLYYANAQQVSHRHLKRDITYVEDDLYEFVMSDIEKLKPSFYKYTIETDELEEGNEAKVRYNMHMGFILDETPDYLQGNTFSGIDIYAVTTLAIAGVQHNRNSVLDLNTRVKSIEAQVSDFGMSTTSGGQKRISYNKDFKGIVPVVTVTSTGKSSSLYIVNQDANGFTVATNEETDASFNWMAMAMCPVENEETAEPVIDANLLSQLRVDEAKKQIMLNYVQSQQQDNLELLGGERSRGLMSKVGLKMK
jgi:F0F1-type ATP synthase membrane subunit c/vacuolar-type H+-ATPase subunit K